MTPPLIAIPGRRSDEAAGHRTPVISGGRLYADAVQRAGGLPVVIPPTDDIDAIKATIARCDAMVLLGGGDVSPSHYGQTERARLYGVDEFIDSFEIAAVHAALEYDKPILAICRVIKFLMLHWAERLCSTCPLLINIATPCIQFNYYKDRAPQLQWAPPSLLCIHFIIRP